MGVFCGFHNRKTGLSARRKRHKFSRLLSVTQRNRSGLSAIVLNVPTIGSLLYNALLSQDMYLAGSSIMILSALTVIGMFLSDILLVLVDPRIRLD